MTKTVHKTLPGGIGGRRGSKGWWGGGRGSRDEVDGMPNACLI